MENNFIKVSKKEYYIIIGSIEKIDGGCFMHHYPEKMLRNRIRRWIKGDYEEIAFIETFLDRGWPNQQNHYVKESLIDSFICF